MIEVRCNGIVIGAIQTLIEEENSHRLTIYRMPLNGNHNLLQENRLNRILFEITTEEAIFSFCRICDSGITYTTTTDGISIYEVVKMEYESKTNKKEKQMEEDTTPVSEYAHIVPGAVVQLKSGSPPMTISRILDGSEEAPLGEVGVYCQWFVQNNLYEGNFRAAMLEPVKSVGATFIPTASWVYPWISDGYGIVRY